MNTTNEYRENGGGVYLFSGEGQHAATKTRLTIEWGGAISVFQVRVNMQNDKHDE